VSGAADDRGGAAAFACDAMCGGLARWLWALGADVRYEEGIADRRLVQIARDENRVLVSSDSRLFERKVLRDGTVRSLFLPRGLRRMEQVRFVVESCGVQVRDPRCMACGGRLNPAAAEAVGDRVPARSLTWATEFFECDGCRRVFWNGSHWTRIEAVRRAAARWTSGGRPLAAG